MAPRHLVRLEGGFEIDDDHARLDLALIHRYLADESYWAAGRPQALVERSIAHSLPLGLYSPAGGQIGFAMATTDRTVFAMLSNVFVLPGWRGRKLGEALVRAALEHPELATVTRWTLRTRDAHALYARFGFVPLPSDPADMQLRRTPA